MFWVGGRWCFEKVWVESLYVMSLIFFLLALHSSTFIAGGSALTVELLSIAVTSLLHPSPVSHCGSCKQACPMKANCLPYSNER